MDPIFRQFFVSLIICLTLLRMIWIFESHFIYRLLAGYELDRALFLRKTEKNILELLGLRKLSNKILAINQDDNAISTTENLSGQGNTSMVKGLEKFSKMKNQEEITTEIVRIKEEMKLRQIELACLENLMFVSDGDGESASNTGSRGKGHDHRYSYESEYHLQHVGEGVDVIGGESNVVDLEKPITPSSPQTLTDKFQCNGQKDTLDS